MNARNLFPLLSAMMIASTQGDVAAQDVTARTVGQDSVLMSFLDTDLRAVIRGLSPYLLKPVLTGELPDIRVSLETTVPVPRDRVRVLLKGLVESRGLVWEEDSAFFRVTSLANRSPSSEPQADSTVRLHVVPLRHARAVEVASTLNLLFGVGGMSSAGREGLGTLTLSDELRRTAIPRAGQQPIATRGETSAPVTASLRGPVSLVPEERTNALLVRASDLDAAVIRQAVEQLDVRPLQVLIEVLVVEVRKDRSFDLGVSGAAMRERGATRQRAEFEGAAAGAGALVLRVMRMTQSEVDVQLSAATARGDARIVTRPVLLATNNAEARFLVGSQRPFVQVSRSLPTDGAIRDQVVQYRDVGTKLTVRPSINVDGYVALEVQQEISNATEETQFGAPIISTREASTEVLVRDGQTIVIGGLSDSSTTRAQSGVPLLSSIPLLGGLFGAARRRASATEVFLFLTPRVIRSDEDVERLTTPRLRREVRPDSVRR